jgi:hypothetical protein
VLDRLEKGAKARKPGGRPRIAGNVLAEMIHLRDHASPRWCPADLALRYGLQGDDPEGAMRQRLTRARKELKDRPCPLCARDLWTPAPNV